MFSISSNFDKHLEKATSINNLEPDWTSIMALCDCVRTNEISPNKALDSIKNKILATNPNIVLRSLEVLESCVKNCGSRFSMSMASASFMQEYLKVLRSSKDQKVRDKMLEQLGTWAYAFRNEPAFGFMARIVQDLKNEGYKFPERREDSDAHFSAATAPTWAEGTCCHRCRTEFTIVIRKHHCRACGQVFCSKCSSKSSPILAYGFETPVRVCDSCYDKINKKPERKREKSSRSSAPKSSDPSQPGAAGSDKTAQKKPSDEELKAREDEELQLALALSLSENENKGRTAAPNYSMNTANTTTAPKKFKPKTRSGKSKNKNNQEQLKLNTDLPDENTNPEMKRYLNYDYWVNRTQQADARFSPSPSAPAPSISSAGTLVLEPVTRKEFTIPPPETNGNDAQMIGNIDATELDEFKSNLRSTLDGFITRLNQNKLRGRAITNDHGVQTMFMNLTNMHSKMIHYIQRTSDARANCERLQDKVSQIRDARAALDALRVEHREEIRRQQEEAERIKQAQMAQKLEIMRLKKQEYLQYQREMAIHRMQEQERELMMMRTGQQPQVWQQQPQAQQFYPNQPMQYPGQQLPSSQSQVPIGTAPSIISVAGVPLSDPNMPQQAQPPYQQQSQAPQPPQYSQYGQPIPNVIPQYAYGTADPPPYSGYNVGQPGVYAGPPPPMHQTFVAQPAQQQPPPPQQPFMAPVVAQQMPPIQQPPVDHHQQQQQPQPVPVNEAPLINFD